MRREHGPNPFPHDSLAGQAWELRRALRDLGRAIVDGPWHDFKTLAERSLRAVSRKR